MGPFRLDGLMDPFRLDGLMGPFILDGSCAWGQAAGHGNKTTSAQCVNTAI